MAARPIDPAALPSSGWRLAPDPASEAQGLIVSGFGDWPTGRALFLEFGWQPGTSPPPWLAELLRLAPVTNASGGQDRSVALAFSYTGLARMGLTDEALASFSRPFREGMFQEDRLRRLGDRRISATDPVDQSPWLETVIADGPIWSGNTRVADPTAPLPTGNSLRIAAAEKPEKLILTPLTVHALVLLYEKTEAAADGWAATVEAALGEHKVTVVHRLPLFLAVEEADKAKNISREHFGFADGLSQPIPFDDQGAVILKDGSIVVPDGVHGVPLGEFVIGYNNGHHEKAPGPIVPLGAETKTAGLVPHDRAEGFADFGRNGSYMVVRQLRQDVAAFWDSMQASADKVRAGDPTATHVTADWLAERVIGRSVDGHLLCQKGTLGIGPDGMPANDFLFRGSDPHGAGCPLGSHVRRANPRDSLAPDPTMGPTLLAAANNHRILRRGRKYGSKFVEAAADGDEDRGLLFMCLNTDIERQFEFVQHTWLLNANFHTLYDETDPLLGPKGPMTIREMPLRRIVDVATFIKMVGGEYFFLPSLPAIDYLARL